MGTYIANCFHIIYYSLINDASFLPHSIPNIQQAQLNTTYIPPVEYCLFSKRLNASREKVENVVKPPHTPVFQNSIVLEDILSRSLAIPTMNPIRTAPIILVINVNIGNSLLIGIRLIAYRATAPKAPPRATNKKLIFTSIFPPSNGLILYEVLYTIANSKTSIHTAYPVSLSFPPWIYLLFELYPLLP